jgi:GTPase SAR1 family protein
MARLATLKERYSCPYFRILVIGRANAGKTTILEKICGVARATNPMIYDQNGKQSNLSKRWVVCSGFFR